MGYSICLLGDTLKSDASENESLSKLLEESESGALVPDEIKSLLEKSNIIVGQMKHISFVFHPSRYKEIATHKQILKNILLNIDKYNLDSKLTDGDETYLNPIHAWRDNVAYFYNKDMKVDIVKNAVHSPSENITSLLYLLGNLGVPVLVPLVSAGSIFFAPIFTLLLTGSFAFSSIARRGLFDPYSILFTSLALVSVSLTVVASLALFAGMAYLSPVVGPALLAIGLVFLAVSVARGMQRTSSANKADITINMYINKIEDIIVSDDKDQKVKIDLYLDEIKTLSNEHVNLIRAVKDPTEKYAQLKKLQSYLARVKKLKYLIGRDTSKENFDNLLKSLESNERGMASAWVLNIPYLVISVGIVALSAFIALNVLTMGVPLISVLVGLAAASLIVTTIQIYTFINGGNISLFKLSPSPTVSTMNINDNPLESEVKLKIQRIKDFVEGKSFFFHNSNTLNELTPGDLLEIKIFADEINLGLAGYIAEEADLYRESGLFNRGFSISQIATIKGTSEKDVLQAVKPRVLSSFRYLKEYLSFKFSNSSPNTAPPSDAFGNNDDNSFSSNLSNGDINGCDVPVVVTVVNSVDVELPVALPDDGALPFDGVLVVDDVKIVDYNSNSGSGNGYNSNGDSLGKILSHEGELRRDISDGSSKSMGDGSSKHGRLTIVSAGKSSNTRPKSHPAAKSDIHSRGNDIGRNFKN